MLAGVSVRNERRSHPFAPLDPNDAILKELARQGIEPDQKLREALRHGYSPSDFLTLSTSKIRASDSEIFFALIKLNAIAAQFLNSQEVIDAVRYHDRQTRNPLAPALRDDQLEDLRANTYLLPVLNRALELRQSQNTLATQDFLLALIQESGRNFEDRPLTADVLAGALGGNYFETIMRVPYASKLLTRLRASLNRAEDFQYFVTLENDRIVFRVASTVGDIIHAGSPNRLLLTHFKDRFGGFTEDEIEELEELLNTRSAKEAQFQRFFERHPHFLRLWDYREVHPHVFLAASESGPLVPDFILTDREMQRALVLELKLPSPKVVVHKTNRERFSVVVADARAQLLRYRDWFRETTNRERLTSKLGMRVYEPRLAVLIGRSTEFVDEIDRQRLAADAGGVEVYTYDDILTYAKRRRLLLERPVFTA